MRRCTSTEAFGDITVPPDCAARVGYHNDTFNETNVLVQPEDTIDHISINNNTRTQNESHARNDEELDHRLPSPEEQCQIIASKYEILFFYSILYFRYLTFSLTSFIIHDFFSLYIGKHKK